MPDTDSFAELIGRVRTGDDRAADVLWRQYEPLLRREIRLRLRDPRLRQRFDEEDVCQSVMASFFVRAAAGQFDISGPEQVQRLLVQMGATSWRARRGATRRHGAIAAAPASFPTVKKWRSVRKRRPARSWPGASCCSNFAIGFPMRNAS